MEATTEAEGNSLVKQARAFADRAEDEDEELSEEEYEEWASILREMYIPYTTVEDDELRGYSLFVKLENGHEFPAYMTRTSGQPMFYSRNSEQTRAGEEWPDDFFFELATHAHEAMAFMPDVYFETQLPDRLDDLDYPDFALGLFQSLLTAMVSFPEPTDEFEPLIRWCNSFTEFTLPPLSDTSDHTDVSFPSEQPPKEDED